MPALRGTLGSYPLSWFHFVFYVIRDSEREQFGEESSLFQSATPGYGPSACGRISSSESRVKSKENTKASVRSPACLNSAPVLPPRLWNGAAHSGLCRPVSIYLTKTTSHRHACGRISYILGICIMINNSKITVMKYQ